jgi:competence protein ComEA
MITHWRGWLEERLGPLKEQARFTKEQVIVLTILALVMLIGGFWAARQSRPQPVVVEKPSLPAAAENPAPKAIKRIYVHVGGAVVRPGLYEIESGNRVADAVNRAGGARDDGDLDGLNLAAKVADGQKILVPVKGQAAEGAAGGSEATAESPLVNLNTASQAELESLDGIGPVLAKRIVDWRQRRGRFSRVSQLNEVDGIGPKKLQALKNQVTVD